MLPAQPPLQQQPVHSQPTHPLPPHKQTRGRKRSGRAAPSKSAAATKKSRGGGAGASTLRADRLMSMGTHRSSGGVNGAKAAKADATSGACGWAAVGGPMQQRSGRLGASLSQAAGDTIPPSTHAYPHPLRPGHNRKQAGAGAGAAKSKKKLAAATGAAAAVSAMGAPSGWAMVQAG